MGLCGRHRPDERGLRPAVPTAFCFPGDPEVALLATPTPLGPDALWATCWGLLPGPQGGVGSLTSLLGPGGKRSRLWLPNNWEKTGRGKHSFTVLPTESQSCLGGDKTPIVGMLSETPKVEFLARLC